MPESSTNDQKRAGIIAAAERLFVTEGYAGTSMDAVAAAARASKATIYARFPAKEDLFAAVMLDACRGIEAPALGALDDMADLAAALREAGRATLYRVFQPRGIAVLEAAVGAKPACPEAMRIYWDNGPGVAQRFVADAIRREQQKGRHSGADADRAARRFMNLATGPFLYGILFAEEELPSRAAMDAALERSITLFLATLEA